MKRLLFRVSLGIGFFLAGLSLYAFLLLRTRPGLPADIPLDRVVRIDDVDVVVRDDDFDFILSHRRIGQESTFVLREGEGTVTRTAHYVPVYSHRAYPYETLIVGFATWLIGLVVFLLRRWHVRARVFYALALVSSASFIIVSDYGLVRDHGLSLLPGLIYNFLYPLTPALLLRFSLTFAPRRRGYHPAWLYGPALAFGVFFNYVFLRAVLASDLPLFRFQNRTYYVFRWYLILFLAAALAHLVVAYRRAVFEEERRQFQWMFFGLAAGLAPFIFLYQLPKALGLGPWISYETSSLFFLFMPAALAFAILKFRLMNITIVINRSLVYSLLTVFSVSLFLVIVEVLRRLFSRFVFAGEDILPLVAAVAAAAAIQPARRRIQAVVDRAFFRQSYDYRRAVREFAARAQRAFQVEHLAELFTAAVQTALPVEKIGLIVGSSSKAAPETFLRHGDADALAAAAPVTAPEGLRAHARRESTMTRENVDFGRSAALAQARLELLLPLAFGPSGLAGWVGLGRKRSGEKFSGEDLDLLETLAGELALNVERVRLHEEVVYERASREKLDELNRLKTEFISSVSHEIRTPMNSIQGLSELLSSGRVADEEKRGRLLELMAGECGRLSRFLHNVLDFGRIERQAMTCVRQPTVLQPIVRDVLELVRAGRPPGSLALDIAMPEAPVVLDLDADAVRQALFNLLDNAVKYSRGKAEVALSVAEAGDRVEVRVRDRGVGIAPEDQARLFEAFYRAPDGVRHNPKGVGLGLKIVRHIMDAHGGRIRVASEPGRGSEFILEFPKP